MTKRKHANQDMLSIKRIKDGKTLTKQTEILDEVKNFYAKLLCQTLRKKHNARQLGT